ncbi:MAG: DegT/DnrJ/EryC1/StrS family aminotransferase [Deltaproteobacteria bacterium]|nr:DegT/DnrJ/EryC1/StrS family aminotransferase [Deltaproteobacteria bacterium]MBW1845786.1 DegT/DnrJ/EryC1/StrS family aminotransferase [Deltaproteobacteria bacterium]MBW2363654.1 DegT/DnrJ/EryC1/StrS family aminotransferase [Deltaproteobacteria bacterium]
MKVPLLDLKKQYETIKDEALQVTKEIFESQYFILGPKVETLEKEIAAYCSSTYARGVSSGTDALLISLMAADIGQGASVITTPYTFFGTAGSIVRAGAVPVFADIDPDTYNISPKSIEKVISTMPKTEREKLKGIIPVHLYGQCADMGPILEIAEKYKLIVIEDAAQAIGSEYNERRAGSMGDFGCFSFYPSKNLGAFGDGGIVTTGSDDFNEKIRILRDHGQDPKYFHQVIGGNFRLDALQAAIVSIKLKHLDTWSQARKENANRYSILFKESGLEDRVQVPYEKENRHIYNQYIIRLEDKRDNLRAFLLDCKIGTDIYYPVPLHLQECFKYIGYKTGDFPVAEMAANHTLAIPVYPELSPDQQAYVVEKITEFYC